MKKVIVLFIVLCSAPAWAEWVYVTETADATFYLDPASIREVGNLRTVSTIEDFKLSDDHGAMSARSSAEYDCKSERIRLLAYSTYPKPMAEGNAIFNMGEDPKGWCEIPPRTALEGIMQDVCAE